MTADKEMIKQLKRASIYEIVEMLRETSSRNAKIDILKNALEYRRGFDLYLKAVYDPYTQYYIRQIPNYTPENMVHTDLEHILLRPEKYFGVLTNRLRTGREAEKFLIYILESVPATDAKAIELIIERDLKAGINVSSINKASPGLIDEYPCMLATAFKAGMEDTIDFPAYVQVKMDGLRANVFVKSNGKTDVRGRSGKTLGLDGYFDRAFFTTGYEYVMDGEIVVMDTEKNEMLSRKKGNGIIRKYAQATISDEDRRRYVPKMIVWDYIPIELFKLGKQAKTSNENRPYSTRLRAAAARITDKSRAVMIETETVESFDEIQKIFLGFLESGEEGVIVKDINSPWQNGRPKNHIKMKGVRDCELFIKDVVEGKGRLKGKLGAFLCESADGLLEVSVGSGFNDTQREEYFSEDLIGKVVSLNFNEVITRNNRKEKSLFLPIFVEVRDDKNTANTLAEIETA